MKKTAISFFSLVILLVPTTAFAVCTASGATVVFVNGIFGDVRKAKDDLRELENKYQNKTGDYKTKFTNGFNPSHVGGFGDLLKSIEQAYQDGGSFITDTDLITILLQIHPQVTTQKIILVGHSQGTYYTNALYSYLTSHGVSERSIAVYNIATPAGFVAGGGQYLTSATDNVINRVRAAIKSAPSKESLGAGPVLATVAQTRPKNPLPPNTTFILDAAEAVAENSGHSFSGVYLENAPSTIVSTINGDLAGLASTADFEGGCFVPPTENILYKTGKTALGVLDFTTAVAGPTLAFAKDFIVDVGTKIPANFASVAGSLFTASTPKPRTENLPGSHNLVGALYGSSVTETDLKDLLGADQGGAVALAVQKPAPPKPTIESDKKEGEVQGAETEKPALPAEPLIPPPPAIGGGMSPGFGGGGSAPAPAPTPAPEPAPAPSPESEEPAVVVEDQATSTPATSTPSTPDPEPVQEPVEVIVYQQGEINDSVDGFNICGGGGCDNFTGVSRDWGWFKRGAYTFDKALASLFTMGVGTGEVLNGRVRLNIYSADTDFSNRHFMQDFIKGNLLYTSDWIDLSGFNTPASPCDAYTPDFDYNNCIFTFSFADSVVLQQDYAYIFAFEGDNIDGAFSSNPVFNNSVQLNTLCSGRAFSADFLELCKLNILQKMMITFVRVGDTPASPSPLDIPPLPPDFTPPVLTMISGPGEGEEVVSTTSPVTFEFSATDNASAVSYLCREDSGSFQSCTSPYTFYALPGARIFTVFATDQEENGTGILRQFTVLP